MQHEIRKFCSIHKKIAIEIINNVVWYICTPTQMKQFNSYEHPVSQKLLQAHLVGLHSSPHLAWQGLASVGEHF
jgi:hypothetical protein